MGTNWYRDPSSGAWVAAEDGSEADARLAAAERWEQQDEDPPDGVALGETPDGLLRRGAVHVMERAAEMPLDLLEDLIRHETDGAGRRGLLLRLQEIRDRRAASGDPQEADRPANGPLTALTADELRAAAAERGLVASGTKADLVARIEAFDASGS